MKKIIVVTFLILMCATCLIGCSGEDDSSNNVIDNETQQEVADSDTEHKDGLVVDDVALLNVKGHPKIADKSSLIDEVYKNDERVYSEEQNFYSIEESLDHPLSFEILDNTILNVTINGDKVNKEVDLKSALKIAKSYLPASFNDNYDFFASGIEEDDGKSYIILYKDNKSNYDICVSILVEDDNMREINIFGYVANIYDIKERFTDSWDYKF